MNKPLTVEQIAKLKSDIDAMSYESLLRLWRNAEVGSPYFQGEVGTYYRNRMTEKRVEVGDKEHVRASKSIGWERY
jgi:hypothetical protein